MTLGRDKQDTMQNDGKLSIFSSSFSKREYLRMIWDTTIRPKTQYKGCTKVNIQNKIS